MATQFQGRHHFLDKGKGRSILSIFNAFSIFQARISAWVQQGPLHPPPPNNKSLVLATQHGYQVSTDHLLGPDPHGTPMEKFLPRHFAPKMSFYHLVAMENAIWASHFQQSSQRQALRVFSGWPMSKRPLLVTSAVTTSYGALPTAAATFPDVGFTGVPPRLFVQRSS